MLSDLIIKDQRPDENFKIFGSVQAVDQDFRSFISKLRNKHFDAFGVFLIGGQIPTFYKQLAQLGVKIPTVGTDFFQDQSMVSGSGGLLNGAVFAGPVVEDGFYKRYVAMFGNDDQIPWAANSYNFAVIASNVIKGLKSGALGEEIIAAFQKSQPHEGSAGQIRFVDSEQGPAFEFPVTMKIIENGKIKELK